VGRGPLAGPVVAAAAILPLRLSITGITDSKKLTSEERFHFYQQLIKHPDIDFGIGLVEATEIDRLNIHNASLEAMKRAVSRLRQKPHFVLIDGCHLPNLDTPAASITKGDEKVLSIGAASILAKVTLCSILRF